MSRNTINHNQSTILACLLVMLSSVIIAQPTDNSPLSRVGFGEPQDVHFVSSYAMGGLGAAYKHLHQANIKNPASLAYLEATAFEVGLYAKRSTLKREPFESTVWSGNLDYLSLSFPVLNPINELLERRERDFSWGLNVSLTPFSRVGYAITSEDIFDSIGVVSRSFQGTGGLYRFNVGNGWRYRDLSVGLNLGYIFGRTTYSTETVFDDVPGDYQHIARSDISYRGFVWSTGLQYDIRLKPSSENNKRFITIGAFYNAGSSFDTERDYINYVLNLAYSDADTAIYEVDQPGTGKFASEFGFGAIIQESNAWSVGIDYSQQAWNEYRNDARPETLSDTWRLAGGVTFTPDFSSISSYFSRVEYRAGVFYQADPRNLEGQQAYRYGVTLGAGLPFVFLRSFSYVNIGLEYGRTGTESALKENYLRGRIGIVLNDNQWFLKRRYN
ncbi:MAG TPA: hypothetical protein VI603_14725 [Saprospiraceae bacterium]|nr:hypothetical protein [Saprospiraceae bacterium]